MASPEIRLATLDDTDALVDRWVELAAGQREYGSHIYADGNRTRIQEAVVRHIVGDGLLVAEDDAVVGFVMFTVENGTYKQDTRRGIVENLYVRPSHRGDGVGSALLTNAEERLADHDVSAISLDVMAANDDARRFYGDHGYTPHRLELEKPVQSDTHSKGDE
jgi:ribosomal protein S18 acetylase RimI-like enzyme